MAVNLRSDIFRDQRQVANMQPDQRAVRPIAELSRNIGRQSGATQAEQMGARNVLKRANTAISDAKRDFRVNRSQQVGANLIEAGNIGVTATTAHERMQIAKRQELLAGQQRDMIDAFRDSITQNKEALLQILDPDQANPQDFTDMFADTDPKPDGGR